MTNEEVKEIFDHNWTKLVNPDYSDEELGEAQNLAIKALSEPTIPLSVIEKIHDAIDNAEPDTYIENPLFYGYGLTKEHVNEIIDKAVKECTHEHS